MALTGGEGRVEGCKSPVDEGEDTAAI